MRIEEIGYGIAYQVTNGKEKYIQINKHLKEEPELYKDVLAHEMEHINSTNEHMDFWIDLRRMFRCDFRMLKFCIKHPATFISYSPVVYDKNSGWGINPFAFFSLGLLAIYIFSIIYIGLSMFY